MKRPPKVPDWVGDATRDVTDRLRQAVTAVSDTADEHLYTDGLRQATSLLGAPTADAAVSPSGPIPKGAAALAPTLQRAAAAAGVPASWASSPALMQILQHESGFDPTAKNPTSTAYGLFQFLDGTWKGTGVAKSSDPFQQALAGFKYIKARYGTPEAAWAFWQTHHWY